MTELEKIAYAKTFIDKLATGINPIDGSVIPDGDVVNNVRLSRCFFYVSDILRQIIDNGGIGAAPVTKPKKQKKQAYFISPEQAAQFEYSDIPITATEIISRIMAVGPQEGVKKFPRRNLIQWLFCTELIEEREINDIVTKCPTAAGKEIGILFEQRQGQHGVYYVLLYNREAQQFIIDNIEAVLSFDVMEYRRKMNVENQCKPWNASQDERLVALFDEGLSVKEIAGELKRTEKATIIRLRQKGIDPDAVIYTHSFDERPKIPSLDRPADEMAPTCQSCRYARSGECFPQKEICSDYEKAYNVPDNERAAWPEMGDASFLRQNGNHR